MMRLGFVCLVLFIAPAHIYSMGRPPAPEEPGFFGRMLNIFFPQAPPVHIDPPLKSPAQRRLEDHRNNEKDRECPICKGPFEQVGKYALSCKFHAMCPACLDEHVRRTRANENVVCPTCTKVILVLHPENISQAQLYLQYRHEQEAHKKSVEQVRGYLTNPPKWYTEILEKKEAENERITGIADKLHREQETTRERFETPFNNQRIERIKASRENADLKAGIAGGASILAAIAAGFGTEKALHKKGEEKDSFAALVATIVAVAVIGYSAILISKWHAHKLLEIARL